MARKRKSSKTNYSSANELDLVKGGRDFFDLLIELIDGAEETIHIQIYIFDADETGNLVAEALKRAAARKVKVWLLVDGYASQSLPTPFIQDLVEAGISFNRFEPFFKRRNFYFGRRMHHKIVVVDSLHGLVGGINISNRYNDSDGNPAWLDWAAHVTGECAFALEQVCVETWNLELDDRTRRLPKQRPHPDYKSNKPCKIGVIRNDWVMRKNQISRTYLQLFKAAQSEIIIMSSYFLPGRLFRRGLSRAVRRGVKVRLILAGKSDIALAKYAERYMYRWLLRHHIRIFEYQPTVLHGKVATMDGTRTTIGSYNVNNISAYSSIELNLDVDDEIFSANVQSRFEKIMKSDCREFTNEDYTKRTSLIAKFFQYLAYWMVRILYYLSTFYFKQKE